MFGCVSDFMSGSSRLRYRLSWRTVFTATRRLSWLISRAWKTVPKAPRESVLPMMAPELWRCGGWGSVCCGCPSTGW
ncbi:hypothetical protein TYRP_011976 [Tyrophagus putrescentiae]|nr:hypothetical protein TYRP_011976 [Tyrophagus putrescentiae]